MIRPALRLQPLAKSRPNPSSRQCHKLNNDNDNLKVRTLPIVPVYRIQTGIFFARSHKSVINYSKFKSFHRVNLWSGLQPKSIGNNASADVFIHSPLLTEGRHITLIQKPPLRIVSMAAMTLISAQCQLFIMFDFVRKRSDRFGPPTGKSVRFSSIMSESSLEKEVGIPWCAFLPHFSYSITFLLFLNFFLRYFFACSYTIRGLFCTSYFHVFMCFFHVVCLCFFVLVFLCAARFVFVRNSYYHFITTVLTVSMTWATNVILFRCWAQFWLCEHGAVTDILTYDCYYRYISESMSQSTCQSLGSPVEI